MATQPMAKVQKFSHSSTFGTMWPKHEHFQNVVLFRNALSFPKSKRFCDFCFSFFRKTQQHNCKQTAVHSFTTNSFTDEVVNKLEIYMKLSNLFLMAVGVVEFSREGYKIRKDFT